jgi:hypothetical protein
MFGALINQFAGPILDKIFPDDADKALKIEARARLVEAELSGEFRELDARMNAIVMEAQSKHMFVALARPAFLYVVYIMILASIPMGIFFGINPEGAKLFIEGYQLWLAAIPGEMWALFGAGYLGYVKSREKDKARLIGKDPENAGLISKLFG